MSWAKPLLGILLQCFPLSLRITGTLVCAHSPLPSQKVIMGKAAVHLTGHQDTSPAWQPGGSSSSQSAMHRGHKPQKSLSLCHHLLAAACPRHWLCFQFHRPLSNGDTQDNPGPPPTPAPNPKAKLPLQSWGPNSTRNPETHPSPICLFFSPKEESKHIFKLCCLTLLLLTCLPHLPPNSLSFSSLLP
jgi:hypothetical protein